MKYIQTDQDKSLEEPLVRKRMCIKENTALKVNVNHQYYYQMQQTMYVTEHKWIDFVVKGSGTQDLYIERIKFDSIWWNRVKNKLSDCFTHYICPELAYPRLKYGPSRIALFA